MAPPLTTFWEKDRGSGYGVGDSVPPSLALEAVKGAGERTPLLAVAHKTQIEPSGSVPREPGTVDVHT